MLGHLPTLEKVLFKTIDRGFRVSVAILFRAASGYQLSEISDKGFRVSVGMLFEAIALHIAVERSHTNTIKVLVTAGTQVDAQDGIGETALHRASRSENEPLMVFFVEPADSENNDQRLHGAQIRSAE